MQFFVLLTTLMGFFSVCGFAAPTINLDDAPGIVGPVVPPNNNNNVVSRDVAALDTALIVTMGSSPVHVGFTKTRNLGQELRKALKYLCEDLPNEIGRDSTVPRSLCTGVPYFMTGICSPFSWPHCDERLEVRVESDYIPAAIGADSKAIYHMFVDQIVKTFEASINTEKNRYQCRGKFTNDHEACTEYANAANMYQVGIHGMAGGIFPHMRIALYLGDWTKGQFDCKGSQTNVWGTLPGDRIQDFAGKIGFPLRGAVECAGEGWAQGVCSWEEPFEGMFSGKAICKLIPDCDT